MGGGCSTNNYSNSLSEPLLGYKHNNKRIEEQQPPEIKHNLEKDTAVERKIGEYKSAVSRFESRVQMQYNISKQPSPPETVLYVSQAQQSGYKNEIDELKGTIEFLRQLMKKQEEAIGSLRQKNVALENRISELATITCHMRAAKEDPNINITTSATMNDLLGCLVALIFLLSVLVGINL